MAISTQDNMELNGERKVRAKLNEKITANYAKYHEYCRNMANGKDDPDDVLQECLAEICSMSASKLETVIPYLDYYIIQMIKYSMRSRTSKYFYKYHRNEVDASSMREARMREVEKDMYITENSDLERAESELALTARIRNILETKCDWYEREVFDRYVQEGKSFRKFAKETGIPATTLFNAYARTRKIIQDNI